MNFKELMWVRNLQQTNDYDFATLSPRQSGFQHRSWVDIQFGVDEDDATTRDAMTRLLHDDTSASKSSAHTARAFDAKQRICKGLIY